MKKLKSKTITPIVIGMLTMLMMVIPSVADADGVVEPNSSEIAYSVGDINDDGVVITQEMIDSAPKPGSMRFVFFSEKRSNPYSEQELEHELTEKDELPWGTRTAGCDTLTTWDQYHDCMFRPWNYGF